MWWVEIGFMGLREGRVCWDVGCAKCVNVYGGVWLLLRAWWIRRLWLGRTKGVSLNLLVVMWVENNKKLEVVVIINVNEQRNNKQCQIAVKSWKWRCVDETELKKEGSCWAAWCCEYIFKPSSTKTEKHWERKPRMKQTRYQTLLVCDQTLETRTVVESFEIDNHFGDGAVVQWTDMWNCDMADDPLLWGMIQSDKVRVSIAAASSRLTFERNLQRDRLHSLGKHPLQRDTCDKMSLGIHATTSRCCFVSGYYLAGSSSAWKQSACLQSLSLPLWEILKLNKAFAQRKRVSCVKQPKSCMGRRFQHDMRISSPFENKNFGETWQVSGNAWALNSKSRRTQVLSLKSDKNVYNSKPEKDCLLL